MASEINAIMGYSMGLPGWILFGAAAFGTFFYTLKYIYMAFKVHVVWGLVVLCVPVIGPVVFLFCRWNDAGNIFMKVVLCLLAMFAIWEWYPQIDKLMAFWEDYWSGVDAQSLTGKSNVR